jgi:hypothetical protein
MTFKVNNVYSSMFKSEFSVLFWYLIGIFVLISWVGSQPIRFPFLELGQLLVIIFWWILIIYIVEVISLVDDEYLLEVESELKNVA